MNRAFLGVDLGTTRVKVGLFDQNGRRVAFGSRRAPPFQGGGKTELREFDLLDYWQCFLETFHDVLRQAPARVTLEGIGFSSQAQSFTAFDKDGAPLRPVISWLDDRAGAEADEIRESVSTDEFYRLAGFNEITALCLAPKLLWLRRHEPEIFDRAAKFVLLRDYFVWRLTGALSSDPTLLSLGGMYDRFQQKYWQLMLDVIGVGTDRLPQLVGSARVCGLVTETAATEIGVPAGVPVVAGCLDQIASAVGVGNLYPGMVSVNLGTVMTIFLTRTEQDVDQEKRMLSGSHVLAGHYFLMPYIQTAGLAVEWFCDVLAPGLRYSELDREAEEIPAGCDGLLFIPHLAGCFSPEVHPDARGHFCNITLRHRRAHFYRAVLEGIAFALRDNLRLLADFGAEQEDIRLFGGGSSSPLWIQIIADVTGRDVHLPDEREASCLGAAMLAAVGSGYYSDLHSAAEKFVHHADTFSPRPETRVTYDNAYDEFGSFQDRTFPEEEL